MMERISMKTQHIIYTAIILLTIKSISTEDCGPKFNGRCSCGQQLFENELKYVVNCTNEGFTNTSVLANLPEQTQVIIFTGNNIVELPWNVFGAFNDLSSLTIVDMTNNNIREIRGKSYHHVQNVKRLILNHNNLSISSDDDDLNHHHPRVFSNFVNLMELHLTNAFADNTSAELSRDLHDIFKNSNLTKLTKLHLEQNEISHFADRRVFCDLPSLSDLHLGDNLLTEINFNVLCLRHLRFLDLERNKFEYVKTKDLGLMDALQNIPDRNIDLIVDFNLNPFVCDCGIAPFQDWLRVTNVSVRHKEDYVCYRNKRYEEYILTLKTNKCRLLTDRARTTAGHTVTLVFLLVVLVFILSGLVLALAYLSRDKLITTFRPVLNNVGKKVHYTSIKDEECPEVHV